MNIIDKQMNKIISDIRKELKQNVEPTYRQGAIRYFKEKIDLWGVRTPIVRKISRKHFTKIKNLPKEKIFKLAEELFQSGKNEEATIATDWVYRTKKQYQISDFKIFEQWLKKYIDNWGKCDDFCTHPMHHFIEEFPEVIPKIKKWTRSKNRWLRRAAAVSFITTKGSYYTTKGNLKDIFEIADTLLEDKDDLVQKGYGWMLKAASLGDQKAIFDYVIKHKDRMPRTALRYAIEHMPPKQKKKAMAK